MQRIERTATNIIVALTAAAWALTSWEPEPGFAAAVAYRSR